MNPLITRLCSFLLLWSLFGSGLHASPQTDAPKKTPADEEPAETTQKITVTATRGEIALETTPRAIIILDRSKADDDPGLSLNEIVRASPGVIVQQRANPSQGDRVTIRGAGARASFGIRGVKILLDGIPLTTPDGQTSLDNVDFDAIGKAELLPGPASSLHGNSAGGVLDLRTRQQAGAHVSPILGSDDLWRGKLHYGRRVRGFDFNVGGSHTATDGYREHANAVYTKIHATGSGKINDRLTLHGVVHLYNAPYLLNPGSLSKQEIAQNPRQTRAILVARGASKKSAQQLAGLTLSYRLAESFTLESTLYGLKRSLENPILPRIIDLDRASGGWRNVVHGFFLPGGQSVQMTVGFDLELQSDQRAEFENLGLPADALMIANEDIPGSVRPGNRILDQKESIQSLAPFAEWTWTRGDWSATLGGRYDRYNYRVSDRLLTNGDDSGSRSMTRFSPMVGLSFHPGADLTLYANRASAFQTPTANELSNRPDGLGGFNQELDPETTRAWELGVRSGRGLLHWSLSMYAMDTDGMILPRQTADEQTFFQNSGQVRTEGLEFKGEWRPRPNWVGVLAYTRTDSRFRRFLAETDGPDLSGNRTPGVPPHRLDLETGWRRRGQRVSLRGRWEDEYFADDSNSEASRNEASIVADLRLGQTWKTGRGVWSLVLSLDNLFDARYNGSVAPNAFANRYFEPAPGRTWVLGFGFSALPRTRSGAAK